jgi:hypothetical protein
VMTVAIMPRQPGGARCMWGAAEPWRSSSQGSLSSQANWGMRARSCSSVSNPSGLRSASRHGTSRTRPGTRREPVGGAR